MLGEVTRMTFRILTDLENEHRETTWSNTWWIVMYDLVAFHLHLDVEFCWTEFSLVESGFGTARMDSCYKALVFLPVIKHDWRLPSFSKMFEIYWSFDGIFDQHAEQWRWLQKLIQITAVTTGWYYLAGAFAKHDSQSSSLFPKFGGQNISKRDCGPAPNVTSLITCSSIFSLPPVLLWSSWMYTPENKHDHGKKHG